MIALASDIAVKITAPVVQSPPLIPKFLPPLNAPGLPYFWPLMILLLAIMFWLIFFYDPGSPSHDDGDLR